MAEVTMGPTENPKTPGPWRVVQFGKSWYVARGRKAKPRKKIGPVQMRGANYHDIAVKECARRNACADK